MRPALSLHRQPQPADGPSASASAAEQRSIFPGWRWAAVALAFPVAGLLGYLISGRIDAVGPALLGGAITGAGLGAALWLGANRAFGDAATWVAVSAAGYAVGLAVGAAAVGYETDLGSLVAMGLISGAVLGTAQGVALAAQGLTHLAAAWGVAMPALLAVGWTVTTLGGIDVDRQFTVFGAYGAIAFTLLSGLLLARFRRSDHR